jgi:hypothetical protein
MSELEQAARKALDALLRAGLGGPIQMNQRAIDSAVGILRAALEQAEPVVEPIGWRWDQSHELYTNADTDKPEAILDRNGEVVIGLCKRCGKGESELSGQCAQQAEPVAWPKKRKPRAAEITESNEHYARSEGYDEGWNDCLAACMKQQAEPVVEPVVEPVMVRCPRCWEPVFAPKAQEQAKPVVEPPHWVITTKIGEVVGFRAPNLKKGDKVYPAPQQAEPVVPWYRQFCSCPKCNEGPKQAQPVVEAHRVLVVESLPAALIAVAHKSAIEGDKDQSMSGNPSY